MTRRQPFGQLPAVLLVSGLALLVGQIIWKTTGSQVKNAIEALKERKEKDKPPTPTTISLGRNESRTEMVRFGEKKNFRCSDPTSTNFFTGTPRRQNGREGCVRVHPFLAEPITDCGGNFKFPPNVLSVTLEGIEEQVWVQVSCN